MSASAVSSTEQSPARTASTIAGERNASGISYLKFLPGGWVVGTSPEIVYDWKANEATIPIDLEVRKTVRMGSAPVQLKVNLD